MESAFFEPTGNGTYRATPASAGPWTAAAQHGGPPSALAAWDMERHEPDERLRLARVTVDILRPIPVGTLTVRTRTLRPGKRVALLETVMEAGGQEVLHARGWRIGRNDFAPEVRRNGQVPAIPSSARPSEFPGGHSGGYLAAIEWRVVSGGFGEVGPAVVWSRPLIPLIAGADPTPMSRTLLVADSGSGIGRQLDPREFLFPNVDLTVVLRCDPVGEWLLLDAISTMGGQGTGMTETLLSDQAGVIGAGLQTQFIVPV